jgi:hypothetical protein
VLTLVDEGGCRAPVPLLRTAQQHGWRCGHRLCCVQQWADGCKCKNLLAVLPCTAIDAGSSSGCSKHMAAAALTALTRANGVAAGI